MLQQSEASRERLSLIPPIMMARLAILDIDFMAYTLEVTIDVARVAESVAQALPTALYLRRTLAYAGHDSSKIY